MILDAALLLEGGWDDHCDWLVFIDTPLEIRRQRVKENRNWSADELSRRESTQWDISEKKQRADYIVDNSGLPEESAAQMKTVIQSILSTTSVDQRHH